MDEYDVQWQRLRSRRNQLIIAFVGYVPITVTFGVLAHYVFRVDEPIPVFAMAWMFLFVIASVRYHYFHCPRCGKWFFSTWWYRNPFARRCVHCKLPLYTTKEEATRQSSKQENTVAQNGADTRQSEFLR